MKSRCIQPSVKPDEMLLLLQTYHELLLLQVHYSKTLTEHDIKHIERHLSMKRTIRKKIMRDLQQAFVQVILSYAVGLGFLSGKGDMYFDVVFSRTPQSLAKTVWGGTKEK